MSEIIELKQTDKSIDGEDKYHFWLDNEQLKDRRKLGVPDCMASIGGQVVVFTTRHKDRNVPPCASDVYIGEGLIITEYGNHNRWQWDLSITRQP